MLHKKRQIKYTWFSYVEIWSHLLIIRRPDPEPILPQPPKLDKSHPNWKDQPAKIVDASTFPINGVAQAQHFAKCIQIKAGLPDSYLTRANDILTADQTERAVRYAINFVNAFQQTRNQRVKINKMFASILHNLVLSGKLFFGTHTWKNCPNFVIWTTRQLFGVESLEYRWNVLG